MRLHDSSKVMYTNYKTMDRTNNQDAGVFVLLLVLLLVIRYVMLSC